MSYKERGGGEEEKRGRIRGDERRGKEEVGWSGGAGLFSRLCLNQHSPCGISLLSTAQVTTVEAEVTGWEGEEG